MGKGGKYAGVIDKLTVDFGEEPGQQEKINEVKRQILQEPGANLEHAVVEELISEITALQEALNTALIKAVNGNHKASHIARVYEDVRIMEESFKQQAKTTELIKSALEQILVKQYETERTTSLTLMGSGRTIRYQLEPHAKVLDKIQNRIWAIKNGLENSLALPWPTLNALTKDALLRGEAEPDGVEAIARPKIVCTPAFKGEDL